VKADVEGGSKSFHIFPITGNLRKYSNSGFYVKFRILIVLLNFINYFSEWQKQTPPQSQEVSRGKMKKSKTSTTET